MLLDLPTADFATIDPNDVRWYAINQGWKLVDTKNTSIIVFNHPVHKTRQIQVPLGGEKSDFVLMMREVVSKFSEIEQRPLAEIVHDVHHPYEDILRLRLSSKLAESGTLPLDAGLKLIQNGREMLVASACSVHQPQAFYPRKSFKPVEDFISRCQLGQTEIGSYVTTILTPPMPPRAASSSDSDMFQGISNPDEELPFERKVTLKLMTALSILSQAVQNGDERLIETGAGAGVSADLCEAVAGIPAPDEAVLQISFAWSPLRPIRQPNALKPVRFVQSDLAFIKEAGRKLRKRVVRTDTIEGHIYGLAADPTILPDSHGTVTIRASVDGKYDRVRFNLGLGDYKKACDAHRDGRKIRVEGILNRGEQSKLFEMPDIIKFQVI